jgi:hypothetical protein
MDNPVEEMDNPVEVPQRRGPGLNWIHFASFESGNDFLKIYSGQIHIHIFFFIKTIM